MSRFFSLAKTFHVAYSSEHLMFESHARNPNILISAPRPLQEKRHFFLLMLSQGTISGLIVFQFLVSLEISSPFLVSTEISSIVLSLLLIAPSPKESIGERPAQEQILMRRIRWGQ
jgi:hypothetical protein